MPAWALPLCPLFFLHFPALLCDILYYFVNIVKYVPHFGLYKVAGDNGLEERACPAVKNIRKPCAGKPNARLDEGGGLDEAAKARLLRHRRTKGAVTDSPGLKSPEPALYSIQLLLPIINESPLLEPKHLHRLVIFVQ